MVEFKQLKEDRDAFIDNFNNTIGKAQSSFTKRVKAVDNKEADDFTALEVLPQATPTPLCYCFCLFVLLRIPKNGACANTLFRSRLMTSTAASAGENWPEEADPCPGHPDAQACTAGWGVGSVRRGIGLRPDLRPQACMKHESPDSFVYNRPAHQHGSLRPRGHCPGRGERRCAAIEVVRTTTSRAINLHVDASPSSAYQPRSRLRFPDLCPASPRSVRAPLQMCALPLVSAGCQSERRRRPRANNLGQGARFRVH